MRVFVIGITGGIGSRLATALQERGDEVFGLVRRTEQRDELAGRGIRAVLGDLPRMTAADLAGVYADAEAVVYCSGTQGVDVGEAAIDALDFAAVVAAHEAAGGRRFLLVSVMPEAWRERDLSDELEHYFAVKKRADIAVAASGGDWLIVRPSELTDDEPTGHVALGAAEPHLTVPRGDVAHVLAALVHRPGITHRILELTRGEVPVDDAVAALDGPGS